MGKRSKQGNTGRRDICNLRIAFCHPDLGLGGAERLIVDAAAELGQRGHTVDVYTAYYDPNRCFEETKSGLFNVIVRGGYFPRSIAGRAMALCAYVRCMLMAWSICWETYRRGTPYDVIIVDQVSIAIFILRLFCSSKILFYCHFPDLLLASPKSALHKAYRAPLNALEEMSTGLADRILVNSGYTQSIFKDTFRKLDRRGVVPEVLYPAVSIPSDDALVEMKTSWKSLLPDDAVALLEQRIVFLSINRFERKKNIGLAIRALSLVTSGDGSVQPGLIVAGGYDVRLAENVQHLKELQNIAKECGVEDRVVFITSFSDEQRLALLCACLAVLYTPTNEHFGIVPIETMASGTPVIACNSGGPKESVQNNVTGFLEEPYPENFAKAMEKCLGGNVVTTMSTKARKRVQDLFSRQSFGNTLESLIFDMLACRTSTHESKKIK